MALAHLYDKMSPGGYIVFDDYGYWEGCRTAVDEFLEQRGLSLKPTDVDGVAVYFQKE